MKNNQLCNIIPAVQYYLFVKSNLNKFKKTRIIKVGDKMRSDGSDYWWLRYSERKKVKNETNQRRIYIQKIWYITNHAVWIFWITFTLWCQFVLLTHTETRQNCNNYEGKIQKITFWRSRGACGLAANRFRLLISLEVKRVVSPTHSRLSPHSWPCRPGYSDKKISESNIVYFLIRY